MDSDRQRIVEFVRKWGGSTTDAVLDPSMQAFHAPDIAGLISYRLKGSCAIVFGDPICEEMDKAALAKAFHRFMQEQGNNIIYISTSKQYARWAIENVCGALIEFGHELVFDPENDPTKASGKHAGLLRRKVKHALREGVQVHEHLTQDPAIEKAIENVGEAWLKGRRGTQIHISNIYLFSNRFGKRWLYAKNGEAIVGTISLNELKAHKGWHMNHLMITPEAPHGTSELLVVSALEMLRNEGCRFTTAGTVTATQLGEIVGLNKFAVWTGRFVFRLAKIIAHLSGLNTFWGKFHPQSRPTYLLFSQKKIGFSELRALKAALSGEKR